MDRGIHRLFHSNPELGNALVEFCSRRCNEFQNLIFRLSFVGR